MVDVVLANFLPEIYGSFLPSFFQRSIPQETKATCNNCAMCPKPGEEIGPLHFRPDVKCCSFHPNLPNYLVGGILSGTDSELEEGRNLIREQIKNRIGVEPKGILPSRKWSLLYEMAHHKSFGKTQTLICPYFEQKEGNCTIWPFREAVCSTFFCKYERGEDGKRFWEGVKLY